MNHYSDVLLRPWVTEKGMRLMERTNVYPFEVARAATKVDIRRAIETRYGVSVTGVRTMTVRGKVRRHRILQQGVTADRKKALVRLKAGDRIEFL